MPLKQLIRLETVRFRKDQAKADDLEPLHCGTDSVEASEVHGADGAPERFGEQLVRSIHVIETIKRRDESEPFGGRR